MNLVQENQFRFMKPPSIQAVEAILDVCSQSVVCMFWDLALVSATWFMSRVRN